MKKNFIIILLLLSFSTFYGQKKKNGVYFEVGGTNLFYSINYERLLIEESKLSISTNMGATYIPSFFPNSDFNYIIGNSIGVTTLIGQSKHYAEIGFNFSYWYMMDYDTNSYLTTFLPIRLGYRYQKNDRGLFYKLAFIPIIPIYQDSDVEILYPITPHFGIAIGWAF